MTTISTLAHARITRLRARGCPSSSPDVRTLLSPHSARPCSDPSHRVLGLPPPPPTSGTTAHTFPAASPSNLLYGAFTGASRSCSFPEPAEASPADLASALAAGAVEECYVKFAFNLTRGCEPTRFFSVGDPEAHPAPYPPEFAILGSVEGIRRYLRLPLPAAGAAAAAGAEISAAGRSYAVVEHTVIWRHHAQGSQAAQPPTTLGHDCRPRVSSTRAGSPDHPTSPAASDAAAAAPAAAGGGGASSSLLGPCFVTDCLGADAALEAVSEAERAGMEVAGVEISHISTSVRSFALAAAVAELSPPVFTFRHAQALSRCCPPPSSPMQVESALDSHDGDGEGGESADCLASCSRSLRGFCVRVFLTRPEGAGRARWAAHLAGLRTVPGLVDPSAYSSRSPGCTNNNRQ